MSETDLDRDRDRGTTTRSRPLGDIEPAGSRHMWTRSAVHAADEYTIVGEWNGSVTAFDAPAFEPQWTAEHPSHPVGITTLRARRDDELVVVAGRGETGSLVAYDLETGDQQWRYDTATDVGEPSRDGVFALPYVVAVAVNSDADEPRLYVAARRYERDGERRRWHSTILAFDADGAVRWRYGTDASPIALTLGDDGEQVAVGYNRCMGDHDNGVVVLDAETGNPDWTWDPGTEGDRRVGDVSFDGDALAVASHGDKRGYLLDSGGAERWRVDLAIETEIGEERLYAYPNHAYAHDGHVAFVTGNTYAVEGRETEGRHPNEHRIAVFDADGNPCWSDDVRGFAHELAAEGSTIVLPCAQNFRVRMPETHAARRFDLTAGVVDVERFDGIATAAAIAGGTVVAIEEPVTYHDDGQRRGEYVLHSVE
jgi:outer membrane protein assembly factor BamB